MVPTPVALFALKSRSLQDLSCLSLENSLSGGFDCATPKNCSVPL